VTIVHMRRRPRDRRRLGKLVIEATALGGLVALVAAVFTLVVLGLGHVPTDREEALLASSAAAAILSALLWVPLRRRVLRLITPLVRDERDAPEAALRVLEGRLTPALAFEELLVVLAEGLHRTFRSEVTEIWIATGSLLERAVSHPERGAASLVLTEAERSVAARKGVSGAAWAAIWLPVLVADRRGAQLRIGPVVDAGELLGLIVVQRAAGEERFQPREEQALADLARRVSPAFRNVRLDSALRASLDELRLQAAELEASRARVVAAADAERRRIERDLHDGAQQHLVALAVNLRLARELAGADPAESDAVLAQLSQDARDALEQVRALAHGIYPPLLLDSGRRAALAAAVSRAPVQVRFKPAALRRYPADIEATVYFCCLEALQNTAKHAGESACATLHLREESDGLRFEVTDDGVGFDVEHRPLGTGLMSMTDRLGAVGGRLSVTSDPGRGTSVTGVIPIGAR
jgi:signal transduction histidine kinase